MALDKFEVIRYYNWNDNPAMTTQLSHHYSPIVL